MREVATPGATILVVDDEEANVALLEQTLSRAGYTRVFSVTDSREALHTFDRYQPDLVLLDLRMPHLDGHAVLSQLTAQVPPGDIVPIVVLTADVSRAARQQALSAGAIDFLTKPIDRDEFLLRIRNLLHLRFSHLQLQRQHVALEQVYETAQSRVAERDQSISTLTHDLGQPLTTIRGFAQLLQRAIARHEHVDVERLVAGLDSIDRATGEMLGMVQELLDAMRLQAGRRLDLKRGPIDLVALAARQVALQQQASELHHFGVSAPAEPVTGLWDAGRLGRVLANLLSNAVKYSPEGGEITVEVHTEPCEPVEGSGFTATWAVLAVHDHGLGIPPADLPHVFERFHRGANVAGRIDGTGIGLAGARQIVEQHGGLICIDSGEDEGTTVTVRLPIDP